MNLILLEAAEVDGDSVTLADHRAAHMKRVLNVAPGDEVRVGLIDGATGVGRVTSIDGDRVELRCAFDAVPPKPLVDLLIAMPRPKVLGRLWAQLAALGVGRIIVSNAARVERFYFDTHFLEPDVYRPLLVEGLQQARDTHVPLVSIHREFRKLVEDDLATLSDAQAKLVAHPGGASIGEYTRAGTRTLLAVGPEGGWNEFELGLLTAHGFQTVGMGSRTLRTDTACIALLSLVNAVCYPVPHV